MNESVLTEAARNQLVLDFDGLKSKKYDSSSDFTDDIELLQQAIELLAKLVDSPAFDNWVSETESNYGSKYDSSYCESLSDSLDKAKTAVKEFNDHMYSLDE